MHRNDRGHFCCSTLYLLAHAEALLLVHHQQSELRKHDLRREDRVRADDHIDVAACDVLAKLSLRAPVAQRTRCSLVLVHGWRQHERRHEELPKGERRKNKGPPLELDPHGMG